SQTIIHHGDTETRRHGEKSGGKQSQSKIKSRERPRTLRVKTKAKAKTGTTEDTKDTEEKPIAKTQEPKAKGQRLMAVGNRFTQLLKARKPVSVVLMSHAYLRWRNVAVLVGVLMLLYPQSRATAVPSTQEQSQQTQPPAEQKPPSPPSPSQPGAPPPQHGQNQPAPGTALPSANQQPPSQPGTTTTPQQQPSPSQPGPAGPSSPMAAVPANDEDIVLEAVGDVMLGTTFPDASGGDLPPNDGADLLQEVTPILKRGDIVFGNLEGPLVDGGVSAKCRGKRPGSCYAFRVPTRYGKYLKDAGFSV